MTKDLVTQYVEFITPKIGDPTLTLLKSHLLFEELLRRYLAKVLPNSDALDGARLTFAQLLAVARASSPTVSPEHWVWKAMGDLNKLRNSLSHEIKPDAFAAKADAYMRFVLEKQNASLPPPAGRVGLSRQSPGVSSYGFTKIDMVTAGLHGFVAGLLGFNSQELDARENDRKKELETVAQASGSVERTEP